MPRQQHILRAACLMFAAACAIPIAPAQPAATAPHEPTAKETAATMDIANFRTALMMFKLSTGRFPTTDEGLNALITKPPGAIGSAADWPMLAKIPKDPWGHPYIYRCPPTVSKGDYDLISAGPDGKEGTADDITN